MLGTLAVRVSYPRFVPAFLRLKDGLDRPGGAWLASAGLLSKMDGLVRAGEGLQWSVWG